ncbi:MAG: hypothetical protein ABXS91_06490, partial [Sulfurimonas sp.]
MKKICLYIIFLPLTLVADLAIITSTSEGNQTEYYQKGKFASYSNDKIMSIDINTNTIVIILKNKKIYAKTTIEEVKRVNDQLKQEMKANLKEIGMIEEEIEALINPKKPDEMKSKYIGEENIAGYSCEKYLREIKYGSIHMIVEVCLSDVLS